MAHYQQQQFVETVRTHFPEFFAHRKVLEVGSWSQFGSVRDLFTACDYVGTDVAAGQGVDLAVPGQELAFPTGTFDVVISCECFEHNPFWLETFVNMARMLKPGGLFVFTCAGVGRGEHGTSRTSPSASLTALQQHADYYRNLTQRDFDRRLDLGIHFSHYRFCDNRYSKDLYFVGLKRTSDTNALAAEKLFALGLAAKGITLPHKPSLVRKLSAYGEWWTKWAFSRLLGERHYHGLRHRLYRRFRPSDPSPQ
jgi:SAM-dependent methyltransferase